MKVWFRQDWAANNLELVFYKKSYEGGANSRIWVAKPIQIEMVEIPKGENIKEPTFLIDHSEAEELIKSFAEVAKERNIRLDSEDAANAELKATKFHLEDMRKLLFKEGQ